MTLISIHRVAQTDGHRASTFRARGPCPSRLSAPFGSGALVYGLLKLRGLAALAEAVSHREPNWMCRTEWRMSQTGAARLLA